MRLIDADALVEQFKGFPYGYRGMVIQVVADAPTVDAVPSTDVDELKMRVIGAEAAVNGMREQINRMVIINSKKVSVVRCGECAHNCGRLDGYICCDKTKKISIWHSEEWYCADGKRRQ